MGPNHRFGDVGVKRKDDIKDDIRVGRSFDDTEIMVYSCPNAQHSAVIGNIDSDLDVFWAYTYWDYQSHTSAYWDKTSPKGNVYFWMSYDFLYEAVSSPKVDPHTLIHGGAMHGCCYDELYSDDSLLNSEVKTALSGAFTSMGRTSKLECIGYDACLMQVQDVAEFNSAYFNYMVGSEESEAGAGWDYDGGWLTSIYNNPSTITTPTLLTSVADTFITDNGGVSGSSSGSTDQTLSWLDLSKMSAYKSSWESMASYLSSNVVTSSNASSFRSLLKGCKRYAVDSDNSQDYFGTIDAKDFLDKLLASSTFNKGSVSTYVAAVSSAFSALVGYSTCQTGAGNSNGLCCFFSLSSDSSQSVYYAASQTNFSNWRSLSSTYGL